MMIKWHIFTTIILIQLKTFYCNTIEISSYSKVAKNTNQPPQIHRAREGVINSDLWFPKTFNETEMNINSNKDQATDRAIDNNRPFPFPLKNVVFFTYDKPSNHRVNHEPRIIYPSAPVQKIAQDRFVPHESTDHFLEKNKRNRIKSQAIYKESDREGEPPQVDAPPSNTKPDTIDYQPPKNLYSFPPNSDALYPPPEDTRQPISVSSYLPPPSGPTNYPIYPGPILSKPPENSGSEDKDVGSNDDGSANMGDNGNMDNGSPDQPPDNPKPINIPPPDFIPNKNPQFPSLPFLDHGPPDQGHEDHDHSHDHPPDSDHHEHHDHHDDHFHDHGPFSSYDDSLKHLHLHLN